MSGRLRAVFSLERHYRARFATGIAIACFGLGAVIGHAGDEPGKGRVVYVVPRTRLSEAVDLRCVRNLTAVSDVSANIVVVRFGSGLSNHLVGFPATADVDWATDDEALEASRPCALLKVKSAR